MVRLPVTAKGDMTDTKDRMGNMWGPCAYLSLHGLDGAYKAHVMLIPDQLRRLSAMLSRTALFIESRAKTGRGLLGRSPCLCAHISHRADRDAMCPAYTDERTTGMCGACWTPERGQQDHK
jgi:hypothetical protein